MGHEECAQLLDLIPNGSQWKKPSDHGHGSTSNIAAGYEEEEKQLELRLGPPGVPISCCSSKTGPKRPFLATSPTQDDAVVQQKANGSTAVAHNSSKRTVSTPVVGWPPVRSFRKNLASTSNKSSIESQKSGGSPVKEAKPDNSGSKGLFVKINMEGVPIGRKVDLKAYDNYDKLSFAVDELFRGLLEAQRNPLKHVEKSQAITGLVDGTGEYTLIYEDDEGDKMLVGDVPWDLHTEAPYIGRYKLYFDDPTVELYLLNVVIMLTKFQNVCFDCKEVASAEDLRAFVATDQQRKENSNTVLKFCM